MTIPFLFTIAFAIYCAWTDAHDIKMGITIDHIHGWIMRAVTASAIILFAALFFRASWWHIAVAGIGCAFLFSAVFRFALNKMRGLDWRYMSPSSWYDALFIGMVYKDRELLLVEFHKLLYRYRHMPKLESIYTDAVHRAGTIATIAEVVIAGVCAYIVL